MWCMNGAVINGESVKNSSAQSPSGKSTGRSPPPPISVLLTHSHSTLNSISSGISVYSTCSPQSHCFTSVAVCACLCDPVICCLSDATGPSEPSFKVHPFVEREWKLVCFACTFVFTPSRRRNQGGKHIYHLKAEVLKRRCCAEAFFLFFFLYVWIYLVVKRRDKKDEGRTSYSSLTKCIFITEQLWARGEQSCVINTSLWSILPKRQHAAKLQLTVYIICWLTSWRNQHGDIWHGVSLLLALHDALLFCLDQQ